MEDYKERMIEEYKFIKDKAEKLHSMCVKFDASTLDFELKCPIGLLRNQESIMRDYLRILEVRAEIEGIGIENLQ